MIEAFVLKDIEKATKIHLQLLNIFQTLFMIANPIPVKAALNMIGDSVGGLRLPLTPARENVLLAIKKDLDILGIRVT